MKIRIFALARDLGLDSKVLIDICEEAGVKLRNALATISEEERDQIVEYIRRKGSTSQPEPTREELPPAREPAKDHGKVRTIRTMPARSSSGRSDGSSPQTGDSHEQNEFDESDSSPEVGHSDIAEELVAEPELPVAAELTAVPEPKADLTTTPEPVAEVDEVPEAVAPATPPLKSTRTSKEEVSTATPAVVAETPAEAPITARPASPTTASPATVTPSTTVATSTVPASAVPASTVAPAASSAGTPAAAQSPNGPVQDAARRHRMRDMREMRPIGSVKEREAAAQPKPTPEKAPPKAKAPARPLVAAPPSIAPPVVKKPKVREERAQKPDMALSDIVNPQSPLADQLRQLKQARAEHEGEDTVEVAKAKEKEKARRGSLLKELRESREAERQAKKVKRKRRSGSADLKTTASISFPITVRALSEAIGRPAKAILQILFKEGRMATMNDELGEETAMEVALELGVDLQVKRGRDIEAELLASLDHEDPPEAMKQRPPIITILGHVDHGKTTLVDTIRRANVAAGEAGGITQHIAAYQVNYQGHLLTFVDTPGHAAFGEMRSRGANVTDIVVLVVAADDGVMPQTIESISHAKNAGVPIVVALNKIDLPGVDEQRILQQLAQHELLPAEWGGEYEVVRTSGSTGKGVEKLLETLLLTAELHELQANPEREALGVCLEAFRDEGRGALAWMIVQKGTLRVGDVVLCGSSYGRIRAIYNDRDEEVESAGPSTPVKVAGLNDVPGAGDHFFVMKDIEEARETAENRKHEGRTEHLSRRGQPLTLEDILNSARKGEGVQELPLILKADTPGSIEALRSEINKFEHPEVKVSIIHEGIGGVNESDVYLASAAGAIIIAFHVIAEDRAQSLAEREGVEVRRYNIIYEVTDHIRLALQGMLRPERVEVATGRAIVLRTFSISRFGTIAGCRVLNGTISRDNRVHVIRDQKVLNDYRIGSLKREKDDAKEVRDGMECGIRLDGFNDVKEGDLLEAYRIDEVKRTLD
ncbi:MAG: translation initiation factor IF-2 [Planctomyces sp.]|nr:translation initiation factor IF-2 [Planctomyces sp.]